jgi:Domain of unknown function (DUF4272)
VAILVNAYSTLRDPVTIDFSHTARNHRQAGDAGMREHLNGFMGFVCEGGEREMTPILFSVMRHIDRVHQHYSFEIDDDQLDALADWGWRSNSIYFFPDGTVRDPAGAVLVDPGTGEAQAEAAVPFPPDAVERAKRSNIWLANRGILTLETLPPAIGFDEVVLRSADDVAWRIQSLFIVAVRAESVATGSPIPASKLRAKSPHAFEAMTPLETAFVQNSRPDQTEVMQFAWRYEALYALQWALSLHDELKFADEICDVPLVAETMLRKTSREMIVEAQLRSPDEILDALDLNGRMLWAARQATIDGHEPPASIDGGVLSERQHAFNWLVRFGEAPWDEVDTPT